MVHCSIVHPLHGVASTVIADLLKRQPHSPGRTRLAWEIVVGPALARVTRVEMRGTVLDVTAADPRWLREIERAKPAILARLQHLLGDGHITRLTTS
jgi:predicted nucleic acid-binding Zn ribbon protein